jgi:hypothetical protein
MPRTFLKILLSLFISVTLASSGSAQLSAGDLPGEDSISWYIRMKYGLDQELYNGIQYQNRNLLYKGDPCFPDDHFYEGSVTLKGITYHDLQLKYDCYSQHLILAYTDFKKQYNELIINSILVDSFSLGDYRFKNTALSGPRVLFYQVLESGPVTCFVHWKREIQSTHNDLRYLYEYTGPGGAYYIGYGGRIYPVNSRRTFTSIFPQPLQPQIRKYFRRHRFRFRDAGPVEIQSLLNFVSSHSEPIPGT